MKTEENRINFAKYMIFCYVEEMFTCICDLINPNIGELMNMDSHGLNKEELIVVLNELFSNHMLVAMNQRRGLFTPTLEEIENTLKEKKDHLYLSENTFYGFTTGAMEFYHELQGLYKNKT